MVEVDEDVGSAVFFPPSDRQALWAPAVELSAEGDSGGADVVAVLVRLEAGIDVDSFATCHLRVAFDPEFAGSSRVSKAAAAYVIEGGAFRRIEVELGAAPFGEEHPVGVGDLDLAARGLDDRERCRHRRTILLARSRVPAMPGFKCEVVAVGTELLLGQVVDTNSSWIGEQLAMAGIDSHFQTKVGDNPERIRAVLEQALDRSDVVIVCGGLGPTQDDLTRDVLAAVMEVELVLDEHLVAKIEAIFGDRKMPLNNLCQAEVPVGAEPLAVMPGTAPGLRAPVRDKVIYAVPGVPWEMKQMVGEAVLPDIKARAGITGVIRSKTLRTWGESESGLAELLHDEIERLDRDGGATLAFLASGVEGLRVRITAKADTEDEVDVLLADEAARVRSILGGQLIFSESDESMEAVVLELCRNKGVSLGAAESLTGGLIGSRITAVPGASDVFKGSIVSYASAVKFDVLGVPHGPVVSEEAVSAMAEGACRVLDADVSVAVTGVAGPEGQDGQEVGRVWMATCVDGVVETTTVKWGIDRERIRQFTTIAVMNSLRLRLLG